MSTKEATGPTSGRSGPGKRPTGGRTCAGPCPVPSRPAHLADGSAAPPTSIPTSVSTTTPNGRGATRSAWPGRRGPRSSPGPSWPPWPSPRWKASTASDHIAAPVIFAANHFSHLDTPLVLSVLPDKWRHKIVTLAAADYFFDTRLKAVYFAFSLNAVPIERNRVSRDSADRAEELLSRGLEPAHLPRGRPQPRRLGPGAPGRRGVAGRPQRPSPRTPAYRRHGPPVAPRRQAHIHRQDQRDLRGARVPGPARPPAGRPPRGGHRRPRRRGRHGLVVGPVEGGGGDHTGTDRS